MRQRARKRVREETKPVVCDEHVWLCVCECSNSDSVGDRNSEKCNYGARESLKFKPGLSNRRGWREGKREERVGGGGEVIWDGVL